MNEKRRLLYSLIIILVTLVFPIAYIFRIDSFGVLYIRELVFTFGLFDINTGFLIIINSPSQDYLSFYGVLSLSSIWIIIGIVSGLFVYTQAGSNSTRKLVGIGILLLFQMAIPFFVLSILTVHTFWLSEYIPFPLASLSAFLWYIVDIKSGNRIDMTLQEY